MKASQLAASPLFHLTAERDSPFFDTGITTVSPTNVLLHGIISRAALESFREVVGARPLDNMDIKQDEGKLFEDRVQEILANRGMSLAQCSQYNYPGQHNFVDVRFPQTRYIQFLHRDNNTFLFVDNAGNTFKDGYKEFQDWIDIKDESVRSIILKPYPGTQVMKAFDAVAVAKESDQLMFYFTQITMEGPYDSNVDNDRIKKFNHQGRDLVKEVLDCAFPDGDYKLRVPDPVDDPEKLPNTVWDYALNKSRKDCNIHAECHIVFISMKQDFQLAFQKPKAVPKMILMDREITRKNFGITFVK